MAARPQGNILYEILIVVLVVVLIGTILYPARVWEDETELQEVCQTRMETIQQMEFSYLGKTSTYSDSMPGVKDVVLSDPNALMALDSLVNWDKMVTKKKLESLVLAKQFPEDLRSIILSKLNERKSLGNLIKWDSLGYNMVSELKSVYDQVVASEPEVDPFQNSVIWAVLLGQNSFDEMTNDASISRPIRRRANRNMARGRMINEIPEWRYFKPYLYEKLGETIDHAKRTDIWLKDDQDRWEKETHLVWESDMDALSQQEKDSIWLEMQGRFWEKEKELLWKKERPALWKSEGPTWRENNFSTWNRVIVQKWSSDRRSKWLAEKEESMPDSLKEAFKAKRDSLWRVELVEIREQEYADWEASNKKYINEVVENLWESERRVQWQDDAQQRWQKNKESDWDLLWLQIKEELWNSERVSLWRDEEIKLEGKINALRKLDQCLEWGSVLGHDRIRRIVNELNLPDNQTLWKQITKETDDKGSRLFAFGLVDLFREALLDSVEYCPFSHTPHLIVVDDMSEVKRFSVKCPIVVTDTELVALQIDPVTGDTSRVALELSSAKRILGGGTIKNHGAIEMDGKKTWEKKGS